MTGELNSFSLNHDCELQDSETQELQKKAESIKWADKSIKKDISEKIEKEFKIKEKILEKKSWNKTCAENVAIIQLFLIVKWFLPEKIKIDWIDSVELQKAIDEYINKEWITIEIKSEVKDNVTQIENWNKDAKPLNQQDPNSPDKTKAFSDQDFEEYKKGNKTITEKEINDITFINKFCDYIWQKSWIVIQQWLKWIAKSILFWLQKLYKDRKIQLWFESLENIFLWVRDRTMFMWSLKMINAFLQKFVENADKSSFESFIKDKELIRDIYSKNNDTIEWNKYEQYGCSTKDYWVKSDKWDILVRKDYYAVCSIDYNRLKEIQAMPDWQLDNNQKNNAAKKEVFAYLSQIINIPWADLQSHLSSSFEIDNEKVKLLWENVDIHEYVKSITVSNGDIYKKLWKLLKLFNWTNEDMCYLYTVWLTSSTWDISSNSVIWKYIETNFSKWREKYMDSATYEIIQFLNWLLTAIRSNDKNLIKNEITKISQSNIIFSKDTKEKFFVNIIDDLLLESNLTQADKKEMTDLFNYVVNNKRDLEINTYVNRTKILHEINFDNVFDKIFDTDILKHYIDIEIIDSFKSKIKWNSNLLQDSFLLAIMQTDKIIVDNNSSQDYAKVLLNQFKSTLRKSLLTNNTNLQNKDLWVVNLILDHYSKNSQLFEKILLESNIINLKTNTANNDLNMVQGLMSHLSEDFRSDKDLNTILSVFTTKWLEKPTVDDVVLRLNENNIKKIIVYKIYWLKQKLIQLPDENTKKQIKEYEDLLIKYDEYLQSNKYKKSSDKVNMFKEYLWMNPLLQELHSWWNEYQDKRSKIQWYINEFYSNNQCIKWLNDHKKSQQQIQEQYENNKTQIHQKIKSLKEYDYISKFQFEKDEEIDKKWLDTADSKTQTVWSINEKPHRRTRPREWFFEKWVRIPDTFRVKEENWEYKVRNPFYNANNPLSQKEIVWEPNYNFKWEFFKQFILGLWLDITSVSFMIDDFTKKIWFDFSKPILSIDDFNNFFNGLFRMTEKVIWKYLNEWLKKDLKEMPISDIRDQRLKTQLESLRTNLVLEFNESKEKKHSIKVIIDLIKKHQTKFKSFDLFFANNNSFDVGKIPDNYFDWLQWYWNYFEKEFENNIIKK